MTLKMYPIDNILYAISFDLERREFLEFHLPKYSRRISGRGD